MKKAILTLTLAAFAVVANAQIILGGSFNVSHNGGTDRTDAFGAVPEAIERADASTSFGISPKVSYKLNDKMQAGLSLTLGYDYNRAYSTLWAASAVAGTAVTDNSDYYTSTYNWSFGLAPYFRYYVTKFGKFNLFAEAEAALNFIGATDTYTSSPSATIDGTRKGINFALTVVPGLNYAVNDHISFDIYVDLLRCGWAIEKWNTDNSGNTPATGDYHSTTHTLGFVANASAQPILDSQIGMGAGPTLGGLLTSFRIGFNYAL